MNFVDLVDLKLKCSTNYFVNFIDLVDFKIKCSTI